jgi:hypothetical protein
MHRHRALTERDHCSRQYLIKPSFPQQNSHDTTGSSSTGVTSLERVGVSTLTEIILAGVYDNGSANDGLRTEEGNVLVCFVSIVRHTRRLSVLTSDLNRGVSGGVSLDVSCLSATVARQNGYGSLPRSPTCRSESSGPPWFFPKGLKWAPAEVHPLLHISLIQIATD